ncbi:MAG TPA: hypothetical protein VNW06_06115 [Cytophagaceae bacterium]|jgi:hypothetical protein|nr:hypothetical protein [Cytophagaceae bacterium]
MKNQNYIEICKALIEKKFSHGSYLKWTNGDYDKLSELISEDIKEYISASSLKRIFGKVNYASEPSTSTLSILAKYIGYRDWYDFINQHSSVPKEITKPEKKRGIKALKFALPLLVIGLSIFILSLLKQEQLEHTLTFHTSKSIAPSNVVFEYDISKMSADTVSIDFNDHFARDKRENLKVLSADNKTITHTYMVSGVYHPILLADGKPIDTLSVSVYSDNWEFLIARYSSSSKEFYPVTQNSVYEKDGIMTIPASEVYKYTKDTITNYWLKYRYLKDFNTKADQLTFNLRGRSISSFKNNCNEFDIWILGSNNNIIFKIFDPGCGGEFSKVQLGIKILDGNFNDLSAFGHSLSVWRTISLKVLNKKASIFIDGKVIYEGKIEGEIGLLKGFVIHTKGTAEFDYVNLEADGKMLMKDDF